jgi:hypothetical protein
MGLIYAQRQYEARDFAPGHAISLVETTLVQGPKKLQNNPT